MTRHVASRSAVRADLRAGVVTAVAVLLLGAPAGLLWAGLAPAIDVQFDELGRPGLVQYESGQFFSVDVRFLFVSVAVGALAGLVAVRVLRGHAPAVAAGVAVGGVAAGWVARIVGERVVVDERVVRFCDSNPLDGFCQFYDGRLALRASQLVVALAFAALVAVFATTFFHRPDELVDAPGTPGLREVGQF